MVRSRMCFSSSFGARFALLSIRVNQGIIYPFLLFLLMLFKSPIGCSKRDDMTNYVLLGPFLESPGKSHILMISTESKEY